MSKRGPPRDNYNYGREEKRGRYDDRPPPHYQQQPPRLEPNWRDPPRRDGYVDDREPYCREDRRYDGFENNNERRYRDERDYDYDRGRDNRDRRPYHPERDNSRNRRGSYSEEGRGRRDSHSYHQGGNGPNDNTGRERRPFRQDNRNQGRGNHSNTTTRPVPAQRANKEEEESLLKTHASPTNIMKAVTEFLEQAQENLKKQTPQVPAEEIEIEARLGILEPISILTSGKTPRRITSSGPKQMEDGQPVEVYTFEAEKCKLNAGICRTHYMAVLSKGSPIATAFQLDDNSQMEETESTETVYGSYPNDYNLRVSYQGVHPPVEGNAETPVAGRVESKTRIASLNLCVPAASSDVRINLAQEAVQDSNVAEPPAGWTKRRVKRRRVYSTPKCVWQVHLTQVTTYTNTSSNKPPPITYEVEVELKSSAIQNLLERNVPVSTDCVQQLQQILLILNPQSNNIPNSDSYLQAHPNQQATDLAKAHCAAMDKFIKTGASASAFQSPLAAKGGTAPPSMGNNPRFVGCMPVGFARHHIEQVQHGQYFLSEKTDGVRYFMIFTGDTVVLLGRDMQGKQPIHNRTDDAMGHVVRLVKPGTVLDGEVVVHRGRPNTDDKPRPIFIVFDVLAISENEPVLHLPFAERYKHLKDASFATGNSQGENAIFDPKSVFDPTVALPLVRKNFVPRTELDNLMEHVKEERGIRIYRNGDLHNHTTDGIIFQPNQPYVCGTDFQLLKWKYLDTVTIDVLLMRPRESDPPNTVRMAAKGLGGSMFELTTHIRLPQSERLKLEADRVATGARCAEIGFHPETGEWYYVTVRPEKQQPNSLHTVLSTLLELAESLSTVELRSRMSVPPGSRDTYAEDSQKALEDMFAQQRKEREENGGN